MKKLIIASLIVSAFLFSHGQDLTAYGIFTGKGGKSSWKKLVKSSKGADIILFGEYHNNPIAHWMQLELTKELSNDPRELVLGAEMFERDQAGVLDSLVRGELSYKDAKSRTKFWPNFKTDYLPLVEVAKEKKLDFIATNIPRKYARLVSKKGLQGLDSLPDAEKKLIVPLPFNIDYELPSYASLEEMALGHDMGMKPRDFVAAQAIKDATMAYFLLQGLEDGQRGLHFNGSYHSDYYQSMLWYIREAKPDLKVITISVREYPQVQKPEGEDKGAADFIIVVPESMTKTY